MPVMPRLGMSVFTFFMGGGALRGGLEGIALDVGIFLILFISVPLIDGRVLTATHPIEPDSWDASL